MVGPAAAVGEERRSLLSNNMAVSKNLRDLQRAAIVDMLHFNNNKSNDETFSSGGGSATACAPMEASTWKVLILDSIGQKILSPVMKVNDLRDHGVTLYLQLHSERQAVSDVPAVYFVEPSAENIGRICKDLAAGLYESFYLNFTSVVPRVLLEDLAYNAVQCGSSALIAKVFDQYLNYITLEDNLFSLNIPDAFVTLNNANSSDSLIDSTLDHISAALFSVLLGFGGQAPLIYASKGTAAESLGEKLDTKIRNYLVNAKTFFLGSNAQMGVEDSLQRPLLILLDRNFDLATPLRHTSTYNALVHDVLGMKLNRVTAVRDSNGGQRETKVYDIDMKDSFWRQNARLPFPTVAENVDLALNNYKIDMQQITKNQAVANLQNLDDLNAASSMMTAEELKTAITVLPELTERKRIIDSHLQISTILLEQIKARDLGNLFHIEQQCATDPSKAKIIEILRSKEATASDKMRLFLVYFFVQEEISKEDLVLFESLLKEAGCETKALEYCKKVKSYLRMSAAAIQSTAAASTSSGGDFLQSFGSRLTGGVLGNVLSSVKNLLPESADTPITKMIDSVLESAMGTSSFRSTLSGTPKDDSFTIIDPKSRDRMKPAIQKTGFNHLIVFVVGGSNYAEYNHVVEFMSKKQSKSNINVTFGSTELFTGEECLEQLSKLGN